MKEGNGGYSRLSIVIISIHSGTQKAPVLSLASLEAVRLRLEATGVIAGVQQPVLATNSLPSTAADGNNIRVFQTCPTQGQLVPQLSPRFEVQLENCGLPNQETPSS